MSTPLPLSPFITDPDNRFVLDEGAFMAEIMPKLRSPGSHALDESLPVFISSPRPEFISATQLAEVRGLLSRRNAA
jgi:hypothetical protein